MKVKEESEKVGLKINIQKTKIMASSPITSWQIDGETMEAVTYFILGGAPKSLQIVTAAIKLKDTCSLEKKVMANLDSILKSRAITFQQRSIRLVKAMVFPVLMYGYEIWTIKKAECQRLGAFKLWCWRRLLRVHWTARRSTCPS